MDVSEKRPQCIGAVMFEKFENVDKQKQQRILDAALQEFSDKGYMKANTNSICKQADISKGLLFHYFGSKKNLYAYVLDQVTQEMMRRLIDYMPKQPMDLFDLIAETSAAKLRIGIEMPEGYRLIYEAFINTPKDLEDTVNHQFKEVLSGQRDSFDLLVDESKFKEDIDKKRAIDLIFACSKGMFDQYLDYYKELSPDEALEGIDEVKDDILKTFGMLKVAFYKPEYC